MIDGDTSLLAVAVVRQAADRLSVEHLRSLPGAHEDECRRAFVSFVEAAAGQLAIGKVQLQPGVLPDDLAAALGYRAGIKPIKTSKLAAAAAHLEAVGVPLWRDGTASLSLSLYYRGVWAALALLAGLGSVSVAVLSGGGLTWFHIVAPALLCAIGTLFAIWQIFLVVKAARRGGRRSVLAASAGVALAAIFLIGAAIHERAVPSLTELWNIYSGDVDLGDLDVSASADGKTLFVEGAYRLHSDEVVRRALEKNKSIREVVLAGPGGRVATGFEIYGLIRERKLATRVDTECASACTIAFLGGADRSISPHGRLGFHRASFPGLGDNDMYESNRGIQRFLLYSARLTPEFTKRVLETPASSIWVPTPQELLAGKVINRVNR